ncbi:MAG: M48 family metalloprotease [Succinivibrionaceae bacterium]
MQGIIKLFFVYLAVVITVSFHCSKVYAGNYDFGIAGVKALPVEKEQQIGEYFIKTARSQLPIIYDPVLQAYINSVVGRLANKAQNVYYPFETILVNDNSVNAAAFLGGKIMINTGVFLVSNSESEFVSVLAHEMIHVTQRHLARSIEAQEAESVNTLLGFIGSIILGIINPALGMASVTATLGAGQQHAINYTRSHEYEADRLGIELLYNANYNPLGMADMMRNLYGEVDKINPAFEMLLSHPLSANRVGEAENRARLLKKHKYYESVDFDFAKSRIEVRYSDVDPLYNYKQAKEVLTSNKNSVTALYKLALSSLELRKYDEAESCLNILQKKYGNNLFVLDSLSDLYIAKKEFKNLEKLLLSAKAKMGDHEVIVVNLASGYIEQHKYEQAIKLLKRYSRKEYSVTVSNLLIDAYKKIRKTCDLYVANTMLLEYKGLWNEAIYNGKEASRICAEQNTVLKIQALIGRITQEKDFYEQLVHN